MIRSGALYRIIAIFAAILEIVAVKHWRVTENGKLQPQHDSVFDMRRPHDLVTFLEQEKRRETANVIYKKISRKEVSIDNQFMGLSMTDVESSNSDCLLWDKSSVDVDVHASIAIDHRLRDGIDQSDLMLYNVAATDKQTVPDCQSTFALDFSIYTFEHLKAMQNRKNLTQHEERSLMSYLPLGTDLDQYGHQLAYSLSRNNTSWIYLNLASIYWRIKGDAYNALECSRRAIVCAPRQYRDIPLLTTAGILHAAKYSGEAAIILHTAIDHYPMESYHHLALGHIYASLGDFNRSIACYDNCLKLSPDTADAKQMKYAILCHRLLETTLLQFDQRLRNVLSEIHTYHDWKEEWFKLYEHMLWEQDIKSATREIKLAFAREQNLHLLEINPMEQSIHDIDSNVVLSYTDLEDRKKIAENMLQNVHLSLHLLKNLHKQMKDLSHVTQDVMLKLNMEHNELFVSPTKNAKYQRFEIKRGNDAFEAKDWPKISDCDGTVPFGDENQYLSIYLPPENKGYLTRLFVNEFINMEPGKTIHRLPWRPPKCHPKSYNAKYIAHNILDATVRQHSLDASLMPFLHNLVPTTNIAEIGQRILTATKRKVAAPWVLSVLASLYWRVVGKSRLALDCLQLALDAVPREFRDVPLISIASIHHKVGLIDDALRITDEALQVNAVEPMTNFLFGILLNVKENYTGAMHYLKQALRVDPHLCDGKALLLLKTLACREKFNVITYNEQDTNNCVHVKIDENKSDILLYNKKKYKVICLHQDIILFNNVTLNELYMQTSKIANNGTLPLFRKFPKIPKQEKSYYENKIVCNYVKNEDRVAFLFMFHNYLRRNITIKNQIESLDDDIEILQPICEGNESNDGTKKMQFSQGLQKKIEIIMNEWLITITETQDYTLQKLGTKIALALQKNSSSWTLALAASFYWRMVGDNSKAIDCALQSLEYAPQDMANVLFVNLAFLYSLKDYSQALEIVRTALTIFPDFIVNHYIFGNLHAAMGNFEMAEKYYKFSLELDSNFMPAITRMRLIQCISLFDDEKSEMSEILWSIL